MKLINLMKEIYFIDWEDDDAMVETMKPKFDDYFLNLSTIKDLYESLSEDGKKLAYKFLLFLMR